MTKALIGVLSLALVGVGGLVAAVDGFGDDRPIRSVTIPAGTTTGGNEDVSGPCDELEHANDPRCTGADTTTGVDDDRAPAGTTAGTTTMGKADVSGPCDEPEHANDPRCTGAGTSTAADDDHSGSDDGHDNSGPGGSGEDNSGSGSDGD